MITVKFVWRQHFKECSIRSQDYSLDVADIESLPQQLYKTGLLLREITQSSGVKLYLVDKARNEIYFCSTDEKVTVRNRASWKIRKAINYNDLLNVLKSVFFFLESGKTISAYVAWAKESVMTKNLYSDDRYPEGINCGDLSVTSVICVPVLTRDMECSVVIELYRNNGVYYEEVRDKICSIYWYNSFMFMALAWLRHCELNQRMDGLGNWTTSNKYITAEEIGN